MGRPRKSFPVLLPLVILTLLLAAAALAQAAAPCPAAAAPTDPPLQLPLGIVSVEDLATPCALTTVARATGTPHITKISPTAGKRGSKVTITGTRFGKRRGQSYVKFGTFKCTRYLRWTSTKIICRVPAKAAGTVAVRVKTSKGLSNRKSFRVTGVSSSGTLYQETNTRLRFLGAWESRSSTDYSGGKQRVIDRPGAVMIDFTGTQMSLVATKGPAYGKMRVWVDGIAQPDVDLYARTAAYRRTVYSKTGLTNAAHRVVLEWTGRKNASASRTLICLDGVRIVGSLTQVPAMTGGLVGFWATPVDWSWVESYMFRADGSYTYLLQGYLGSTLGLLRQEGLYLAYQAQDSMRIYLFDRRERFTPSGGPDGAWEALSPVDWPYVITAYTNATKLNISNGWGADYWLQP